MIREDGTKGFFVAFDYSQGGLTESDAFFRKTGKVIIALASRRSSTSKSHRHGQELQ